MNDSVISLDRLHDIVLPPEVPWWPIAPGWYVVLGILLVLGLVLAHRAWKRHRANAYRRAALRELAVAQDVPSVAELLRRTALAVAPREDIAEMTGIAWLDWLSAQSPEAVPDAMREQLTTGVYDRRRPDHELTALREFAARWIAHHRSPLTTERPTQC